MANVQDIDRGWKNIFRELEKAKGMEVAVGILEGSQNEGVSIAEYASYNEFGTDDIPSRPFMAMSFDENVAEINSDFQKQANQMVQGKKTATAALTVIGQKHAGRIQNIITGRNILPRLAESTVKAKKGSTKTLVDSGAMANAVQISIRGRQA
jgi:hypothetical protein